MLQGYRLLLSFVSLALAVNVRVELTGDDEACASNLGSACRTITKGLLMAGAGGVVSLGPGTFSGPGNCDATIQQSVTLFSDHGPSVTIIDCQQQSRCLTVNANTTIQGIGFTGGNALPAGSGLRRHQSISSAPVEHPKSFSRPFTFVLSRSGMGGHVDWFELSKASKQQVHNALEAMDPDTSARMFSWWKDYLDGNSATPNARTSGPLRRVPSTNATWFHRTNASAKANSPECPPAPPETEAGCEGIQILDTACGSLTEGSIDKYQDAKTCEWIIDPPDAATIRLSFSMLDIEPSVPPSICNWDFLQIIAGDITVGKYCGNLGNVQCDGACEQSLFALTLRTPVRLHLHTDNSGRFAGFEVGWQLVDAPRDATYGGCVLVQDAVVRFDSVHLSGGMADWGGGIAIRRSTVQFRHCSVNSNVGRFGAGIFVESSSVQLDQCSVEFNNALIGEDGCSSNPSLPESWGASGGGIFAHQQSVLVVRSSQVYKNVVQASFCDTAQGRGGGVYMIGSNASFFSSLVAMNQLLGGQTGGGLHVETGTLLLSFSTIRQNSVLGWCSLLAADPVDVFGGGLYSLASRVSLMSSNISGNEILSPYACSMHSGYGGGVKLLGGRLSAVASRITNNSVVMLSKTGRANGGGLEASDAVVEVFACLIEKNIVRGGGLVFGGGISVRRSVLSVFDSRITQNLGMGSWWNGERGGGIRAFKSTVRLSGVHVCHNTLTGSGRGEGGALRLDECQSFIVFSDISANTILSDLRGGAARGVGVSSKLGGLSLVSSNLTGNVMMGNTISGCGLNAWLSSVSVVNSVIENNTASGFDVLGCGADILLDGRLTIIFLDSRISRNRASGSRRVRGPGLALAGYGPGSCSVGAANLSVTGVKVTHNEAFVSCPPSVMGTCEIAGGGIFGICGSLVVKHCEISGNVLRGRLATAYGGGVAFGVPASMRTNNTLLLISCQISENLAVGGQVMGGGVFSRLGVTASSSSISANSVHAVGNGYGGGLFIESGEFSRDHAFAGRLSATRCVFDNNSITGVSAAGGGVWSTAADIGFSSCSFKSNIVGGLTASGGGLSLHRAHLHARRSEFFNNMVAGDQVLGGAVTLDSVIATLQSIKMVSNACNGNVSSIGAALNSRASHVTLRESLVMGNFAGSGGAFWFYNGIAQISRTRISRNRASGVAGAILANAGVHLVLADCQLDMNRALLADNLFAYGTGLQVIARNSTLKSNGVLSSFVQGSSIDALSLSSGTGRVTTAHRGWECRVEISPSSEVIRFVECPPGQFLMEKGDCSRTRKCAMCPLGASCRGGPAVFARLDHWGLYKGGRLTMLRCPEGYCCNQDECWPHDYCSSGRTGQLCGQCEPGTSSMLGSALCAPDSDCWHIRWILPLTILLALFFTLGLVVVQARTNAAMHKDPMFIPVQDGGDLKVLIFFFQVIPLVVSAESLESWKDFGFLRFILSAFSLTFEGSQTQSRGYCPIQGFSSIQKMVTRFIPPAICFCWLLISAVIQKIWHCVRTTRGCSGLGNHLGALFVLFGLAYATVVKTTFDLVLCVPFMNQRVLFYAGHVECYQPWQNLLIGGVVPCLIAYPMLLGLLVYRTRRKQLAHVKVSNSLRCILKVISSPFKTSSCFLQSWEAFLLFERLILCSISVFVTNATWRSWGIVLTLLAMLFAQLVIQPFRRSSPNLFMTICLELLVAIGAWEVGVQALSAQGWFTVHLEFVVIASLFMVAPFCWGICVHVYPYLKKPTRHAPSGVRDVVWLTPWGESCELCDRDPTAPICDEHAVC